MIFITNAIRILFAFLDSILFGFFILTYNLFNEMIGINIFSNEIIAEFSTRIYFMLGIFMVLKLSFSFLSFAVNPDNISNKDAGVGKLITNTFVVLILIGLTPFIFGQAMELQEIIIDDELIPNIILGSAANQNIGDFQKNAGEIMAYKTALAFIRPNTNISASVKEGCKQVTTVNKNQPSGLDLNTTCEAELRNNTKNEMSVSNYKSAIQNNDYNKFYNWDVYTAVSNTSGEYLFNYLALGSTIVLGLMVLVFVGFTMDVALRTIKLGFLQLIAPIAIISYIDPKNSKSGMLSKWIKASTSTYMDLFIRIIAINFAVFVVGVISSSSSESDNPLIFIFIMIGAFMFAKQLPQLLGDMLGFKGGDFQINPWNKIPKFGQQALAGGAGFIVGGLAGGSARAVSSIAANKGNGFQKTLAGFKGFASGGLSGGSGSFMKSYSGAGKGFFNTQMSTIGSQYNRPNQLRGTTFLGRTSSGVQQRMGLKTEGEIMTAHAENVKKYGNIMENIGRIADRDDNVKKAQSTYENLIANPSSTEAQISAARNDATLAKQTAISNAFTDTTNPYHAIITQLSQQATSLQEKFVGVPELSDGLLRIDNAANIAQYEELALKANLNESVYTNSAEYKNAAKVDKMAKPAGSK